jgi:hypothetical protein
MSILLTVHSRVPYGPHAHQDRHQTTARLQLAAAHVIRRQCLVSGRVSTRPRRRGFHLWVHVYLKVKKVPRQSQVCSHSILSIPISEDAKMTSLSTSLIIHGDLTKVADFYGTVFAPNVTILSAPTSVSTNNLQSAILQIYSHNFTIFNLGPDEKPSPATSFMINCDNGQDEVDTLWSLFLHIFIHWQLILK